MDDTPFLEQIADDPGDNATRLVYADWLEDRGDPRAAFLRVQLAQALDPGDRSLAGRLDAAGRGLPPGWLARVDRTPIDRCGWFDDECPRRWEWLRPDSEEPTRRTCEVCQQEVRYCASLDEARRHVALGARVSVRSGVARRPGDLDASTLRPFDSRSGGAREPDEDDEDVLTAQPAPPEVPEVDPEELTEWIPVFRVGPLAGQPTAGALARTPLRPARQDEDTTPSPIDPERPVRVRQRAALPEPGRGAGALERQLHADMLQERDASRTPEPPEDDRPPPPRRWWQLWR